MTVVTSEIFLHNMVKGFKTLKKNWGGGGGCGGAGRGGADVP